VVLRETGGGRYAARLEQLVIDDLPAGEVLVAVDYSDLNYKTAWPSLARQDRARAALVPGIDFAGRVIESADPSIARATGWC